MKEREKATEPEMQRIPTQPSLWQDILYLLLKIAGVAVAAILFFTFIFGLYRMKDASMKPAFKEGDLVFYYQLDKRYVASDTLVLEYEGELQVRRVIAVAGDTVDITEEGMRINGALQVEREIYEETDRYEDGTEFPLTVPEGEVFVLADAREHGTDSRIYGTVRAKDTLGKVMTILRRRNI